MADVILMDVRNDDSLNSGWIPHMSIKQIFTLISGLYSAIDEHRGSARP